MANEKEALIEELKKIVSGDAPVMEVKDQVDGLKNQFFRLYNPEEDTALEAQFHELLAVYKAKRAEVAKAMETAMAQNLERKQAIIAQMKEMAQAETADVMDNLKKVRDLQAEWKTIGQVAAPKVQEIAKLYNQYLEQFYDLVKINIELRDLDFKKNLEMKLQLCEAAEKLVEKESIVEANRVLQKLHEEWAQIGPVARELREEIWTRFKEASTVINKKHQAYFDELHQLEEQNLAKKQVIIEKLKEIDLDQIKSGKQWDEFTEKITALQAEWRAIGFAPRKYNQAIYEEFRALCDAFFKQKTAYYKSLRDELGENLKKKRDLVTRAEELMSSVEQIGWREATDAFVALQAEWKTIGPVARKFSDEIWKQFTDQCDAFFNARREAGKAQHEAYLQRRQEEREERRAQEDAENKRIAKMKTSDMWEAIGEKWKVTKK